MIGGVAGAGIAIGPILGGWATTELSWRVVFVGEVVLVVFILAMTRLVADAPEGARPQLRLCGRGAVRRRFGFRRTRRVAVEYVGLGQAEELPGRAVRILSDVVSSSPPEGR